jgi:phosphorylcholine metabolism protein LicD
MEKYTINELKRHKDGQKIIYNMLIVLDLVCRQNNLSYWCCGGTLIGAVRHKGWIPHDGDIDVAMLDTDYIKLREILQKKLPTRYWLQDAKTDPNYTLTFGKIRYLDAIYSDDTGRDWHSGLQLDILLYTNVNNKLVPYYRDYEIQDIDISMIFPLKKLIFENTTVWVPNEYKLYITNVWGACPPPELDKTLQYPGEGRMSYEIPDWIKKKYTQFY